MNARRQEGGRTNQKRRTRLAITRAAADLVAAGMSPTVAEAADAAGVSRATAYRYFSTQESLLLEVLLDSSVPDMETVIESLGDAASVEERLVAVIRAAVELYLTNEPAFRAMLRGSLEKESERRLRGGRRMGWIERALAPLRDDLSEPDFSRLVSGLSILCGVETLIVLRDVVGIDDNIEILQIVESSAKAMLRGTVDDRGVRKRTSSKDAATFS
jgi:AcrR family transcriptional regulator